MWEGWLNETVLQILRVDGSWRRQLLQQAGKDYERRVCEVPEPLPSKGAEEKAV